MTESPLITINQANADITRFITLGSWNVNEEGVYESWEDASRLTHKGLVRTKISGEFSVRFMTISDYEYFLDLLNNPLIFNTDGSGTINCDVYVNNKKTVKTIDAFIDFKMPNYMPVIGTDKDQNFQVKLEER